MDEISEDMYGTLKPAIDELDAYVSCISERIGCVLSEISSEELSFDVSDLSMLDLNYINVLNDMNENLSGDSEIGGISLIQSLRYNMDVLENPDDIVSSGMTYDIDPSEKKKINYQKNEKVSLSVESLKSVKASFDKDIIRALVYKRALMIHLDYIDNFDHEIENKDQFRNELEKTKFLLQSSFLLYIGHTCIFERLLDINKSMSDKGLWIIGSDFIENCNLSFIDVVENSLPFGKDIIRDEYRLSSFLKESNDPETISCIGDGIFDESKTDKMQLIIDGVYKMYSSVLSQSESNI